MFLQFCLFQRLRTENRLLKQRIDTLEKVSESVFVTVRHCALLINFTLTHSAVYVHISCVFPNDGVLSFTNWAVLVESCWYAIMDWHGECSDCRQSQKHWWIWALGHVENLKTQLTPLTEAEKPVWNVNGAAWYLTSIQSTACQGALFVSLCTTLSLSEWTLLLPGKGTMHEVCWGY